MSKYTKYYIIIGIVSLALGLGTGFLIKGLTQNDETIQKVEINE